MTILEAIVLFPLLGALVILLGAPARFIAQGCSTLVFLFSLYVLFQFNLGKEGGFQFTSSRTLLEMEGFPTLSLAFGLDGMSAVMLILSTLVLMAATFVAPKENLLNGRSKLYYTCIMLIGAGAIGAFCSTDLFFFYAFHELALIPTFLMIGMFGRGENRTSVAWTITIFLGVGSLVLLVGLLWLVQALGATTFDIEQLTALAQGASAVDADLQKWIFLILLIGFGVLVSLFPLHSWAPAAYAQAPAPVAMLHAGVLKKFGLYGLLRVAMPMLPAGAEAWTNLILVLLLGNILYIGFVTIAQSRLDMMLGYSSVMHMGYVFLGVISVNEIGLGGAILLMFAHGVSIAVLYALCGAVESRYGTLNFDELGGIAKSVPRLGVLFGMAAFASIGLPGFANFAAEVAVFFGAFRDADTNNLGFLQWAGILAIWGVVISAVYMLRAFRSIFMGPQPEKLAQKQGDISLVQAFPVVVLVAALLLIGFKPELLNQFIRPIAHSLETAISVIAK